MAEAAQVTELRRQVEALQMQLNAKKTPVATSSGGLPDSKHLDGQNYADWKFLMKNFLVDAGLWCCIEPQKGAEIDPELDQRALAKINLSVKPIASAETKKANTAKEAWDFLRNTYEDKGVVRRIGLYSSLFRTKYDDCKSMTEYIDHITSIAEQLDSIGKPLDDETVGGIILGGLPETFRPLILGIQGSNQTTTVEFVKNLLLQENVKNVCVTSSVNSSDSAFYSKYPQRKRVQKLKKKPAPKQRCFNCNELGHFSVDCPKPKKSMKKPKTENVGSFFTEADSLKIKEPNDWYLDSGCNAHMTPKIEWIKDFRPVSNRKIDVANGNIVPAHGTGTVTIPLTTGITATAHDVIHAPDLSTNLLSISQIVQKGKTVIFDARGCRIVCKNVNIPKKNVIATATQDKGLYKLDVQQAKASAAILRSHDIWHRRLGHLNRKDMKLLQERMSTGMNPEQDPKIPCVTCVKGKQHRKPFPKFSGHRAQYILELVHSDLCGPMQTTSIGGSRYFLTFTDDYSRKSYVYFLKTKDEVKTVFADFKALVENETGKRIKTLRSDNGGEYVNKEMRNLLKSSGIRHQTTVPGTPEQNGVAERLNRTLVEKARTMLIDAGLPNCFWAEAVYTANYLKNRSPTKAVPKATPEEIWSGKRPDLSHLKVFGCKALVHIPDRRRRKWDPKSEERIFVGYSEDTKGYRVIHPVTKKLSIERDIIFIENEFIGKNHSENSPTTTVCSEEENSTETEPTTIDRPLEFDIPAAVEDTMTDGTTDSPSVSIINDDRYPTRTRTPNTRIFNEDFIVYQANLCHVEDPQTFEEAMSRPDAEKWKSALEDEVQAHVINETWELCDLPKDRKAIKSRWTFKVKYKADGTVDKYKARLVAKGYSQEYGIDYEETFSPTVRHSSIRFLISLAAKQNLDLDQMDVVTAFLHPDLEEEIYMELPENTEYFRHRYCRLKKSIYGLKQASRVWYHKLDETLQQMGLQRSKSDPCIYFKCESGNMLIVAVYVDDLLILSNNKKEKKRLQNELKQRFRMKDLGAAHYILGIQITRDRPKGLITLDQSRYIKNMLKRFKMEESKDAPTPLAADQSLTKDMSPKTNDERRKMENIPYREAVGSLLYASQGTRPDICHAVGIVSRFSNDPGQAHWTAVKRIFRYLKGTNSKKLHFRQSGGDLEGFCDSDWASSKDDRRSIAGYVFCNSGGAVSWYSKKQPTVALSTTEAEYMALSSAAQELVWLRQLSIEITGKPNDPVPLYCDNRGAICISKNPVLSPRVKHIDIRHHFIREKVDEGTIDIKFVESNNNAADVLTKPLACGQFEKCTIMFGLV